MHIFTAHSTAVAQHDCLLLPARTCGCSSRHTTAAAHSRHMRPGLPSTKVKPPRHKRHGRVPQHELLRKSADTAAAKEYRRLRPSIGELMQGLSGLQRFTQTCTRLRNIGRCAGAEPQSRNVPCTSRADLALLARASFAWAGLRRSDIAAIRSKAHICDSTSLGELGMERLIPSLDAAASEGVQAFTRGCTRYWQLPLGICPRSPC